MFLPRGFPYLSTEVSVPLEATLAPEFVRKEAGNSLSGVQYQLAEDLWSQQQQQQGNGCTSCPCNCNWTRTGQVSKVFTQHKDRLGSARLGSPRSGSFVSLINCLSIIISCSLTSPDTVRGSVTVSVTSTSSCSHRVRPRPRSRSRPRCR